jgi:folate-binding protein YgfZ
VDESRLAVEARLEWAIHFAKGCYVGQEVVERAVSRGRINHELALVELDELIAAGARVEGGGENDVVTSIAESPRCGRIALAYLPKTMLAAGTVVTFASGESRTGATVLEWPRSRTLPGRS